MDDPLGKSGDGIKEFGYPVPDTPAGTKIGVGGNGRTPCLVKAAGTSADQPLRHVIFLSMRSPWADDITLDLGLDSKVYTLFLRNANSAYERGIFLYRRVQ
jgi:hypothetical protein